MAEEKKVETKVVDLAKFRQRKLNALNQMKNQAKAKAIADRLFKK